MSRIARKPLEIPGSVQLSKAEQTISVKGPKGELKRVFPGSVSIGVDGNLVTVALAEGANHKAMVGTAMVLLRNMVTGVSAGFEKKLKLVGVGYRAKVQGKVLELSLGFSHPVQHPIPEGITITTPSNTEIVIQGVDKERVGQIAAEIRAYRSPEPYKGKGVRYEDERIVLKETKKK